MHFATLLFVGVSRTLAASNEYVEAPDPIEVVARGRAYRGHTVVVGIQDSRPVSEAEREAPRRIRQILRQAYPNAELRSGDFFAPSGGTLAFQIQLVEYRALYTSQFSTAFAVPIGRVSSGAFAFSRSAQWGAMTSINARVLDLTTGSIVSSRDVQGLASRPDALGYETASRVLQDSWAAGVRDLLAFLDMTAADVAPAKEEPPEYHIPSSVYMIVDRLYEDAGRPAPTSSQRDKDAGALWAFLQGGKTLDQLRAAAERLHLHELPVQEQVTAVLSESPAP